MVIAPFFAAIIIATQQAIRPKSLGDVVLILLVGLRQIKFGKIVAAFNLVREATMHDALIDSERSSQRSYLIVEWSMKKRHFTHSLLASLLSLALSFPLSI